MKRISANNIVLIKIFGTIVLMIGIAMAIPWIFAEVTGEADAARAFRICTPVTLAAGIGISAVFRSDRSRFRARDGYLVVSLCWVIASLAGAFPYYLSGSTETFIDALFESTSGFTTTGSTVLAGGLASPAMNLWKALSHWLGGMGILILAISVLPALGISSQFIVRAEAPGPVYQKTTTRFSSSARVLYLTYFSFTVLEFILLMCSRKLSCYDAVITTLGCISTGGLYYHPGGIGLDGSLYIELVLSVFCILASINFLMYYYLITGRFLDMLKDIELRAYLLIIAVATILCSVNLITTDTLPWRDALREGFFQTACMASTAGFVRSDGFIWPASCQLILLILMIVGGCSSSTAGSVKVIRILVMFKLMIRGMTRRIHPRSVVAVKLGGSAVSAPVVSNITVFLLTYAGMIVLSALLMSLQSADLETSLTTAVAMLSNTGTAITHSMTISEFSGYHPLMELYFCLLMIAGRLELFTVLILFTRGFWGRKN